MEPDALRASAAPATALLTGRSHVLRAADPASTARRPAGATPALLVGGGAAAVLAVAILMSRDRPAPPAPAVVPSAAAAPATPAAAAETRLREPPGPLTGIDPDLRRTVEETLAAYGEALEAQDEARLARARPDLSAPQRAVLLAPFKGALNVATDLRVLEVTTGREDAQVTVLRTDVIVDGRGGARAPVEEALRFVRRGGAWTLGGAHR